MAAPQLNSRLFTFLHPSSLNKVLGAILAVLR